MISKNDVITVGSIIATVASIILAIVGLKYNQISRVNEAKANISNPGPSMLSVKQDAVFLNSQAFCWGFDVPFFGKCWKERISLATTRAFSKALNGGDAANLRGAQLSNANFESIHADQADFSNAILDGSIFTNSSMSSAKFNEAEMVGVELVRADLTNAEFKKTQLRGANLEGANISGADFTGAIIPDDVNLNCIWARKAHAPPILGNNERLAKEVYFCPKGEPISKFREEKGCPPLATDDHQTC